MSDVSNENKTIAKTAAAAFGGGEDVKITVARYWDDKNEKGVDILVAKNSPEKGVSSYATVCLSDSPLYMHGKEYEVRLELVGACESSCEEFANILATAAACISESRWFCFPGAIFPDVVSMYDCSSTMEHLFFVPPFPWEDDLKTLKLETKSVAWLLAMPISEAEYSFAEAEGAEKLEDLFVQHQIDIYNINRPSIL